MGKPKTKTGPAKAGPVPEASYFSLFHNYN